jgi:hypothetical protein
MDICTVEKHKIPDKLGHVDSASPFGGETHGVQFDHICDASYRSARSAELRTGVSRETLTPVAIDQVTVC